MDAQTTAQNGYSQNVSSTRSGKRMEYEVIARVTHRLRDAAAKSKQDFPAYAKALVENRRLWHVIAANVASDDNELPESLRARLLYLSEFTEKYTNDIFRDKVSVMPLLEVNVAVMRGLNSEGATQ